MKSRKKKILVDPFSLSLSYKKEQNRRGFEKAILKCNGIQPGEPDTLASQQHQGKERCGVSSGRYDIGQGPFISLGEFVYLGRYFLPKITL